MRRATLTGLGLATVLVALAAWWLEGMLRSDEGARDAEQATSTADTLEAPELQTRDPAEESASVAEGAPAPPPWAITGHVRSPEGEPVSGAYVRAWTRRGETYEDLPPARTDDAGAYTLDLGVLARWPEPVRAAAYLTVVADADDYLASDQTEYVLADEVPGRSIELDLELAEGGTVRGRVVDEAGKPIPGSFAGTLFRGEHGHQTAFQFTEADGTFEVPTYCVGPHVPVAEWGEHQVRGERFDIRGGAEVHVPDLVIPTTTAVIAGVVVRPDGTPEPGVTVMRWEEEPRNYDFGHAVAVTDAAGRFQFAAPPDKRWVVGVETRLEQASTPCKAGDPPIRIVLPPCRLVIRVVLEDGTPLPGAEIDLLAWDAEQHAIRAALLAGTITRDQALWRAVINEQDEVPAADGTEISFVDDDTVWLITARVPGGVPTEATLDIERDAAQAEVTLTVRERLPSAELAVTCVRPDGSTLDTWSGEVHTLAGAHLADVNPSSTGAAFEVPAVPARLTVEPAVELAWRDGELPADSFLLPATHTVSLKPNGEEQLRVAMKAGGRFRLRVAPDDRSRPDYGPADIRIRPRGTHKDEARMVRGWLAIEGDREQPGNGWLPGTTAVSEKPLPPGEYVLSIYHGALKRYEAPLRIDARGTTDVVLEWRD